MRKSHTENIRAQHESHALTVRTGDTSPSKRAVSAQQSSSVGRGKTKPISAGDMPKNAEIEKRSAAIDPKTLSSLRRLPNGDVRDLIIGALKWGVRHRVTTKGIMLYGENGYTATIHFSVSDRYAVRNIAKDLRKLGYDPGRK